MQEAVVAVQTIVPDDAAYIVRLCGPKGGSEGGARNVVVVAEVDWQLDVGRHKSDGRFERLMVQFV